MHMEETRVLLVEDNPGDARLLHIAVADAGAGHIRLVHEERLAPALKRLATESFDVILLDLSLPDAQGIATLVRTHASAGGVPIVVLTGLDDEALAIQALREGAQDYLVKGQVDGSLLVRAMRYAAERKHAMDAVARREEHFRSLIENAPDLISVLSSDGVIGYASPAHERVLGYRPGELAGKSLLDFVHAEDQPRVATLIEQGGETDSIEYRFRHKDGAWRVLDSFLRNLSSVPAVQGIVVNSRDVTGRKKLEEQLHHSQRLEAVGRLAGGIAHDFNNLLMIVTGYSQILMNGMREGDPGRNDLEQVLKAASRASELTRQLLAFSRRQIVHAQVLDLNALVTDMDRMLRRVMGEDVELVTVLAADLKPVRADPGQLEQVLLNLAVNARDAMPGGGKLTIESANAQVTGKTGEFVRLSVSDTGAGIDGETQARMFEPFFTTKEPGKGTGLGLSTSYGIVKQHGGDIWVTSEPGAGATFQIYLPAVGEIPEPLELAAPSLALQGNETILLVEDDAAVRHVLETMLRRHGYEVWACPSPEHALKIAARQGAAVRLLITDVVMPGMGGRDLAARLTALCPGLAVLYISGYADTWNDLDAAFLQKPFAPETLALKVRELLTTSGAG
jgi:two-component system cell cycle sensor histidine kinase/response regulator CckA